jgi:hypothetical protein
MQTRGPLMMMLEFDITYHITLAVSGNCSADQSCAEADVENPSAQFGIEG